MLDPFTIIVGLLLVTAAVALAVANFLRPSIGILLIFILICFFPEFSQTSSNVWSAEDFPSLYNFQPIRGITASGFDYIFALLCAGWFLGGLARKQITRARPLGLPLLLFAASVLVAFGYGLLVSNETYQVMREFRVLIYFAILTYVIVTQCNLAFVRQWCWLTVALAVIRGMEGVVRYWLGIGKDYFGTKIIYYDNGESLLFMTFFFLLAGWAVSGVENVRRHRILLLLAGTPALFSFLFSCRRAEWVGAAVGLAFFGLVIEPRQWVKLGIAPLFLAGTLILAGYRPTLPNQVDFLVSRAQSILDTQEETSNTFRIMDAQNALLAIARAPVLGLGLGGRYKIVYASSSSFDNFFMEHVNVTSHVGYLFVAMKLGLPGFLFYVAIFYLFFRSVLRGISRSSNRLEKGSLIGISITLIAFAAVSLFAPLQNTLRPSLLMAFLLGAGTILLGGIEQSRRQPSVRLAQVGEVVPR